MSTDKSQFYIAKIQGGIFFDRIFSFEVNKNSWADSIKKK
tara:strand:- start:445 stop:564 length:120 start_codon:yes stop_codon:yes gene_type:complete